MGEFVESESVDCCFRVCLNAVWKLAITSLADISQLSFGCPCGWMGKVFFTKRCKLQAKLSLSTTSLSPTP